MAEDRQLLPEIAWTEVRGGVAWTFVVACVLSLLAVPLFQHLLPAGDESGLRAGPFADFTAAIGAMGGVAAEPAGVAGRFFRANRNLKQSMDDLERELERISHLKEQALPVAQWLLLSYGGTGNERVYPGKDGWLYLRGGYDYLIGPPFLDPEVLRRRRLDAPGWQSTPSPDPRHAILDFARQLERRGIHLMVVPAPTKAMIHPEPLASRLSELLDQGLQNPSFDRFCDELETAGVTVADPVPAMRRARRETGQEQFLRTDSHWSPEGLETVASVLAESIDQLGLPFVGRTTRWHRREREVEGIGDLERVLLLPSWQKLFTPQTIRVQRVVSASGRPWTSDSRSEILLLGDSFTNVYSEDDVGWGRSAGLAEQLSYLLGRPVDRLAINAGGASGTRERLAEERSSGRDRLAGKKLVIFQFAIRDLAVGDWQVIDLGA